MQYFTELGFGLVATLPCAVSNRRSVQLQQRFWSDPLRKFIPSFDILETKAVISNGLLQIFKVLGAGTIYKMYVLRN